MAVATKNPLNLFTSISVLFYLSKFTGLITYSLSDYYNEKVFRKSLIGTVWSLISLVHYVVEYHYATVAFTLTSTSEVGTLTIAIGVFIIYLDPLMMSIDIIANILNQSSLIAVFDRLRQIDEKFSTENIHIDYGVIRRFSNLLIIIIIIGETTLVGINFFQFQTDISFYSLWWFVTLIPITLNALSKIWFIVLILNLKLKYIAINQYLSQTGKMFADIRKRSVNPVTDKRVITKSLDNDFNQPFHGYLHKEINPIPGKMKLLPEKMFTQKSGFPPIVNVIPVDDVSEWHLQTIRDGKTTTDSALTVQQKLNKKLVNLCQLHDELCEIGKLINQMFSFQMLILMAYGFMNITAQFYFLYCGLVGQTIPILFRSAESLVISILFIIYTGTKCVCVIYISWQTKLDAQRTGIQLHKIGNITDENDLYESINHLSLKLLNHHLNFTACGFFDLDMTTLYSITGAITSYLIILIQFNLAAQRTRGRAVSEQGTTASTLTTAMTTPIVGN